MDDYNSVLNLVHDLNEQIKHFENLKAEHEMKRKDLEEKETMFSKLAAEAAGALGAVAQIIKSENLRNHVTFLENAFLDLSVRSSLNGEKAKTREEILANEMTEVIKLTDGGHKLEDLPVPSENISLEEKIIIPFPDHVEVIKLTDSGDPQHDYGNSNKNHHQKDDTIEQEIIVSAKFPEANHVELALAPWNWSSKPMEKYEDEWQTRARLPSGSGVQFKFIVDGEWKISEQYPIVRDDLFENNYIDCK